jgi:hypothetical protein
MGLYGEGGIKVIGDVELAEQEIALLKLLGYDVTPNGEGKFSIANDQYAQITIDDWNDEFQENIADYDDENIKTQKQLMRSFKENEVDMNKQCLDYVLICVAKRTGKSIEVEGDDVTEAYGREYFNYIITPEGEYVSKIVE